jgi:DNA-binding transcriptional regulator GbsR (MarR family)
MKITKSELQQIIKEEASNFIRKQELNERKSKIDNILKKLEEGYDVTQEELDEISFKGLGSAAKAIGNKFKGAANKAGDAIKKGAEDVKKAYQSGADAEKYEKAQKELATIAQKIQQITKSNKEQIAQLQKQYSSLTRGKPFKGAVHKPIMNEGIVEWVN